MKTKATQLCDAAALVKEMGVNLGINLCGKKMVTCLTRRLKVANENETDIDNIALGSNNNNELKRMIKQQLKP